MVNELANYHALYSPYFSQSSQADYSYQYLSGLLDPGIARKSAENLSLATLGTASVRAMQDFFGRSPWSEQALIAEQRVQTGLTLGRKAGTLMVYGSDSPKQGDESVGVKRHWCGQLGKQANCQVGVFLGYSSAAATPG